MEHSASTAHLLRDIALFVEVVNARSFTRAAEHLEMPTSTLSRRTSQLERQIGLRLLNRSTRRVEVTDAGAAYFAKCAHLVEAARVAHEEVMGAQQRVQGTLRITCSADFANHYLPGLLASFVQQHPQVRIDLDLSSRVVDLVSENIDLALRLGPLADSSLVARKVGELHSALYASPDYLRRAGRLRTPADLSAHRCLRRRGAAVDSTWRLVPSKPSRSPAGAKAVGQDVVVDGPFVVSSVTMIRKLAVEAAGIGVIDDGMARADVEAGNLVRVLPAWRMPPVELHALTPSRLMPVRVRTFIDELLAAFHR